MPISIFTSREFNQRVSEAKKAAQGEDVVYILDRGEPAHVLMDIEKYRELTSNRKSVAQWLAMPGAESIEFDPQRSTDTARSVDLF